MSYTTDRYSIERLSGQSLAVVQCGIQICDPSHCSGMNIPSCYSISFVIEGKGVYYVEGKEYEVSAGQGFLIIPGLINIQLMRKSRGSTFLHLLTTLMTTPWCIMPDWTRQMLYLTFRLTTL